MGREPHDEYVEETLDFSPGNGSETKSDAEIDKMSEQFHVTGEQTNWVPKEGGKQKIERFGEEHKKWDWLQRLNRTSGANEYRDENRFIARAKDIRQLLDISDIHRKGIQEWLLEESVDILQDIHDSDGGMSISDYSVEVVEVTVLTIAARRLVSRRVDSFDELTDTNPLHSLATDGQEVRKLREAWVDLDEPSTREVRKALHEKLN